MDIERVGVIGSGQMGSGIAEVSARAGANVVVYETTRELADAGHERLRGSLDQAWSKGKLSREARDAALRNLHFTTAFDDLADRQLVIEAIVEIESAKIELFARLDALITDPEAILASNTSSIPVMRIARATKSPDRVLGLHFFNPVPVLPLVELIDTLLTSADAVDRAQRFVTELLGKKVVRCRDRSGFIVNALLVPYLLSAIRMTEAGVATVEDIDQAVVAGLSHPMGPLRLSDLIGLDTLEHISDALYDAYREQQYAAPPLLRRMVEAGATGRKTQKGFYEY